MSRRNPNGYGSVTKLKGKRSRPWMIRATIYDADGNLVISISDTADNFDLLAQNLEWHNKKIKEVSRLEMLRALPRELIKEIRKSRHKER